MATKLTLYNGALRECGEGELSTLSDVHEGRSFLDAVYAQGLKYCLEQGQWNFAIRAVEVAFDTIAEPTFGYTYAFEKADDIVRIVGVSASEFFKPPLSNYIEEGEYWYADTSPIYVRYISDDAEYGTNLAEWPASFEYAVEMWLARLIVLRLTGSNSKLERIQRDSKLAFQAARSKDAIRSPSARFPQGRLIGARLGNSAIAQRRDPNA